MSLIFGPSKVLSRPSERVSEDEFGENLNNIANNMITVMNGFGGVGLAGVQVGLNKRIIVATLGGENVTMINPEIKSVSEEVQKNSEGCLSFPLNTFVVTRPISLTVEYQGLDGKSVTEAFEGLDATIVQHEVEHLDGITVLDKVSRLKRDMYVRKFKKFRKKIGK